MGEAAARIGRSTIDECKELLRTIGDLQNKLEKAIDEEEKKKIQNELVRAQSQYDQMGCGAIDPRKPNQQI
jgi:hypothetical protein